MNYDLTGGTPPKQTGSPIEDNYTMGGYPMGGDKQPGATNPSEVNIMQGLNGSSNKPFPQERNFNQNVEALSPSVAYMETPSTTDANVRLGQIKYAKRAGAVSVYKDVTRNTANDNQASAKAEGSMSMDYNAEMMSEDNEENQNGNS